MIFSGFEIPWSLKPRLNFHKPNLKWEFIIWITNRYTKNKLWYSVAISAGKIYIAVFLFNEMDVIFKEWIIYLQFVSFALT